MSIAFTDWVMSEQEKEHNKMIELLETLINTDLLNILLVGDSGCGKSSLINCIIKLR